MILAALIVAVAMFAKDVLGTCNIAFVARGRALLAGCFDAAGDIAAVLTYGVGGVEAIRHGVSPYTVAIFAGMAVGSLAGTYGGMELSRLIEGKGTS